MSSLNSSKSKIAICQKQTKPIRVLVLGQSAVGKTAMVVRFITRRFIGEYDSKEHVYTYSTTIDNEIVSFEILDSSGKMESEYQINILESNIRWAEAFILIYSVTDKCSFEDVNRLKFLINYNKRRRRIYKDEFMDVPVILVANKIDQCDDRMVTTEEGYKRSREIECSCFHEISVRESIEEVCGVFRDACRFWRVISRFPKLKRSKSDSIRLSMTLHSDVPPEKIISICCDMQDEKRRSIFMFGRSHDDGEDIDEVDELDPLIHTEEPFRSRAKTDGNLMLRSKKWKFPTNSPPTALQSLPTMYHVTNRRNSISMRGHVSC